MITRNNFIVLTGGPGSGKTSVLEALVKKGFHVIPETGRMIIKERLANKLPPRPDPVAFARQMFNIDLANFIDHQYRSDIIFFDRSFLDAAALLHQTGRKDDEQVNAMINTYRYHKKVFIAPPWKAIYQQDTERDQSFEDAVKTYAMLSAWYRQNGYELIQLPCANVATRVDVILGALNI